jgi:hypothetical protein
VSVVAGCRAMTVNRRAVGVSGAQLVNKKKLSFEKKMKLKRLSKAS